MSAGTAKNKGKKVGGKIAKCIRVSEGSSGSEGRPPSRRQGLRRRGKEGDGPSGSRRRRAKKPTDSVEKVEKVVRPPRNPVTRRSRRASFTGKTAKHPARIPAAKHPTRFAASVPAAKPPMLPSPTVRSQRQTAPRAAPAATAAAPSRVMPATMLRAPR